MDSADALVVLRQQHLQLRELVNDLSAQPRVSERILGEQLRARQRLIRQLRRAFPSQEAAKRRHFWPAVERSWVDGRQVVDRALVQRLRIEQMLVKMRWFGDRDAEINDVVDELIDALRRHLAFEDDVLVRLRRTPLDCDLDELGRRLTRRGWARPVRPHPDLPDARLPSAIATPLVALVDHVVEACAFEPTGS